MANEGQIQLITSELAKAANEANVLFAKTKDQSYRDKAIRFARIIQGIQELSFGGTGGGIGGDTQTIVTNYTVTDTDYFLICNTDAGNITITLPPTPLGNQGGVNIKNSGSGILTINAPSGQYIDGLTTVSMKNKSSLYLFPATDEWNIL